MPCLPPGGGPLRCGRRALPPCGGTTQTDEEWTMINLDEGARRELDAQFPLEARAKLAIRVYLSTGG